MPEGAPTVGIIMGSQSDWSTMRYTAETLEAQSPLTANTKDQYQCA